MNKHVLMLNLIPVRNRQVDATVRTLSIW